MDIGEAVEEKGKGWPEKRGRIRVFAGYFMQPAMHPLRINAETRPDLQLHSRLVASAVDSALIQAVFSASSPAMKRRSAF